MTLNRAWARVYAIEPNKHTGESSARKLAWREVAEREFPAGQRVRVVKSDLDEYVGATGAVRGYDMGGRGVSPLISVKFDEGSGSGVSRMDSFHEDEIVPIGKRADVRPTLKRPKRSSRSSRRGRPKRSSRGSRRR